MKGLQWIFFILLFPVLSRQTNSTPNNKIPKILWAYWDSGYESANLFTKLCINNMEYYTKQSGWEFRFLTKENFTNYISKQGQQRVKNMIGKSKYQVTIQRISDIYRFSLLYQNGGMWLDANSFFISNLSWIQNLDSQLSIYNKISDDPDLITFTYNQLFGGNKTRVIDDKTGKEIYLFPGIQCWSIIAKPQTKYLNDILQSLLYSLTVSKSDLDQENSKMGLLYSDQMDEYFLTANYQHQTVLQKKQKEIQKNPQNFTTKYSIDYYKIWSIDALTSAFAIQQFNDWSIEPIIESLLYQSSQSFSQNHSTYKYFFKFTYHFYPQLNSVLPKLKFLLCLKAINKIPNNSILYKYLLQPSLEMPIVQDIILQLNNSALQRQCSLFSASQYNKIIYSIVVIMGLLIGIGTLMFYLIKGGYEPNKQFLTIQNNDS